ncbi:MAG: hypothetical protein CVV44_08155 [Spirochaetae bacterium HGW-Spirochaetae-1]|nr:MAG: hypothetical protein CVV44_08155 [Spirochaetae bacterium HGW-Spirochaetae-1]
MGIGRDITAYKKAEEEIREAKERLQSFMNSATDSMSICDSESRFLDINTKGLSFLGPDIKKEDVIGRYILDVIPQLENSSIFSNYERVLKTGEPSFSQDMTEINRICRCIFN